MRAPRTFLNLEPRSEKLPRKGPQNTAITESSFLELGHCPSLVGPLAELSSPTLLPRSQALLRSPGTAGFRLP